MCESVPTIKISTSTSIQSHPPRPHIYAGHPHSQQLDAGEGRTTVHTTTTTAAQGGMHNGMLVADSIWFQENQNAWMSPRWPCREATPRSPPPVPVVAFAFTWCFATLKSVNFLALCVYSVLFICKKEPPYPARSRSWVIYCCGVARACREAGLVCGRAFLEREICLNWFDLRILDRDLPRRSRIYSMATY